MCASGNLPCVCVFSLNPASLWAACRFLCTNLNRKSAMQNIAIISLALASFLTETNCNASTQSYFNFVQNDTDEIIAVLELTEGNSYTPEDILSLEFTAAGGAFFGISPGLLPSLGNIDGWPFNRTADGRGLEGFLSSGNSHLPAGTYLDGYYVASPDVDGDGLIDGTELFFDDDIGFDQISILFSSRDYLNEFVYGEWVLIPEPSSLVLAFGVVLVGIGRREGLVVRKSVGLAKE